MRIGRAKIEPVLEREGRLAAFPSRHLLFAVRGGAGELCLSRCAALTGGAPADALFGALTLGGRPLVEVQSSGCPTCASLLAAGLGLPEDSPELRAAQKAAASPYAGLEDALRRLRPLLGLLPTGLYFLSRSDYAPTDGAGHFFWDAPSVFTAYPASAEDYDTESYCCLPCFPFFLYPSQPAQKYNTARVDHYRRCIQKGEPLPPALAYALFGYLSVLLDGHHRACACALEGVRVPCLTVSQPGRLWRQGVPQLVWPDESETPVGLLPPALRKLFERPTPLGEAALPPHEARAGVFSRSWPRGYAEAARRYPNHKEAGLLALYPGVEITRGGLDRLICDEDFENVAAAAHLLRYAARRLGRESKPLLLSYAGPDNCAEMRRAAFEGLCQIKDDPEIEALMIQILVDIEQRDHPLYRIADGYWST